VAGDDQSLLAQRLRPDSPHGRRDRSKVTDADSAQTSAEETISRGLASIYAEYMDAEPDAVVTHLTEWSSTTTLRGSLTSMEANLVEIGKGELVRDARRRIQDAMRDDIVALVEAATARHAEQFFSDHDPASDASIEVVTFRR
jgi:uncharacterized protein YbcI